VCTGMHVSVWIYLFISFPYYVIPTLYSRTCLTSESHQRCACVCLPTGNILTPRILSILLALTPEPCAQDHETRACLVNRWRKGKVWSTKLWKQLTQAHSHISFRICVYVRMHADPSFFLPVEQCMIHIHVFSFECSCIFLCEHTHTCKCTHVFVPQPPMACRHTYHRLYSTYMILSYPQTFLRTYAYTFSMLT
jgi:hypothetical protein